MYIHNTCMIILTASDYHIFCLTYPIFMLTEVFKIIYKINIYI